MPALPLDEAGKYVAAAYVVFLFLILVYVAIIGMKVARIEREVSDLLELTEQPGSPPELAEERPEAEVAP
jgi:hypothetical protein